MARLFEYDSFKEVLEQSNMDPNSREDVAEAYALLFSQNDRLVLHVLKSAWQPKAANRAWHRFYYTSH
jgi:hypothetical protein